MAYTLELPDEVKRVNKKQLLKNWVRRDQLTRTFGAEVTNLLEGKVHKSGLQRPISLNWHLVSD